MTNEFPPKPQENMLKRIATGLGEGLCESVTSPITIVKGAIENNPRKILDGAFDAVGMVEIVGSPATFAGRTAFRESVGKDIQANAYDWLREHGLQIPQTIKASGHDCLSSVFKSAHDNTVDKDLEKIIKNSPQIRSALDSGSPGLY